MSLPNPNSVHWYLFGGTGFVGQHLARSILESQPGAIVSLLDIRKPDEVGWQPALNQFIASERLSFIYCDVRHKIELSAKPIKGDVLVNLAAVHREPGHREEEYFETNLKGAENICQLAEECGCDEILFTSSISVYGEHASAVDEDTTPDPKTAYGKSKFQAESIHASWAKRTGGRLIIIRPGVVFGPGEGGNVSRLVTESLRRNRAIQLKPDLAKAGIYIDELIALIHWLRTQQVVHGNIVTVNGVSEELLYFNDYGKALQSLQQFTRSPLIVPIGVLATGLKLASPLRHVVSTTSKFHPDRLIKLTRPNAILSHRLREWGYPFAWPLGKAMADWLSRGI